MTTIQPSGSFLGRLVAVTAAGLVLVGLAAGCSSTQDDLGITDTTVTTNQGDSVQIVNTDESGGVVEPVVDTAVETLDDIIDESYLETALPREQGLLDATSCDAVGDLVVTTYQEVLDLLGDAKRSDSERIDTAYDAFGSGGTLVSARFQELGCTPEEQQEVVCGSVDELVAQGETGEDLMANLKAMCAS